MRLNRDRDLKFVHQRLQVLYKKLERHWEKHKAWFDSCPDRFLAFLSKDRRVVYVFNKEEGSHHNEYPDDGYNNSDPWNIMCLRDKELPLYMNKALSEQDQVLLKQRMNGELPEIPYRQDLDDQKRKLDAKYIKLSRVIGTYHRILTDYLYTNREWSKYDIAKIITMTIEGHTYYFLNEHGSDIKILDESEIERWNIE